MGHHSCCNQQKVKRGLWSPEEDEKLIRYVTTHGYGCWSEVPEKAGPSFLTFIIITLYLSYIYIFMFMFIFIVFEWMQGFKDVGRVAV